VAESVQALRQRFRYEWLALCAGLALIVGLTLFDLVHDRDALDERERERLARQAQVIHDSLVRELDAVNRVLLTMRDEWAVLPQGPDAVSLAVLRLQAFVGAMPAVRSLLVLDADGVVRASNFRQLIGTNLSQRDSFKHARKRPDAQTLYLSEPFRTVLDAWGMNMTRVIPGPNGEFAGLVTATIDQEEIRLILASVNYAPDVWSAVAHSDGSLFLMEPPGRAKPGTSLARPGSLFSRHLESGLSATVMSGVATSTGEPRLMAQHSAAPVSLGLDRYLVVAIGRDPRALLEPWWRDLIARAGLLALLAISVSISLFALQRRRWRAQQEIAAVEAELREKTEQLRHYFDVALNLMCIADAAGRFVKLNPAWQQMASLPSQALEGRPIADFVHPDDMPAVTEGIRRAAAGERVTGLSVRFRHRDGSYRELECQGVAYGPLIYADARDVTQARRDQQTLLELNSRLEAQSAALQALAFVDGLTGIANRRRFDDALRVEWRHGLREGGTLGLLMIDIDHFKAYNDCYGHQAGDVCLREVAQALQGLATRPRDLLARYGGEELVCLLPDTSERACLALAEEMRAAIESLRIAHANSPVSEVVTASIGVAALAPREAADPDQLLRAADAALYRAKAAGRNRVCCPELEP
jgi:diguanylate cyclase (GGDEF)-like protein/PAS domain S-box-containing protein